MSGPVQVRVEILFCSPYDKFDNYHNIKPLEWLEVINSFSGLNQHVCCWLMGETQAQASFLPQIKRKCHFLELYVVVFRSPTKRSNTVAQAGNGIGKRNASGTSNWPGKR